MKREWAYHEGFCSPDECRILLEAGIGNNPYEATIGGEGGVNKIDKSIRDSKVNFLHRGTELESIFQKIDFWVALVNAEFFGVDYWERALASFQFSIYEPGQYYGAHQDGGLVNGDTPSKRKISVTLQLSDGADYVEGDFSFQHVSIHPPKEPLRKIGTILAFPSLVLHEVQPVARGTRYSLVGWYPGPPWR